MKGLFISFEGNDGSGKSSVLNAVKNKLQLLGYEVLYTREPGGSPIAEKIRSIILDVDNIGMDPKTEALLYAASRREHIQKTIIPALEKGVIVLSDRFIDSSLVYQGVARNIGIDEVLKINEFATEKLLPDLTIFVSVHPEIGLQRIKKDERELDRLELEKIDFHNKVYNGYLELTKRYPSRIKVINGEQPLERVINDSLDVVLKYIEGRKI